MGGVETLENKVPGPLPSDGFPCSHGGGSAVQCSTSGFQGGKYGSMLGKVLGWALRGPEKKSYNERARNQRELCNPWHASWHDISSREVLDTKLVYRSRSEAANERRRTNCRGHGTGSSGPAPREAAERWQGNFGILLRQSEYCILLTNHISRFLASIRPGHPL